MRFIKSQPHGVCYGHPHVAYVQNERCYAADESEVDPEALEAQERLSQTEEIAEAMTAAVMSRSEKMKQVWAARKAKTPKSDGDGV